MTCPRCDSGETEILAVSPIAGQWEMHICRVCNFSWRSTEPTQVTDPSQYHPSFKLTKAAIDRMTVYPPLP